MNHASTLGRSSSNIGPVAFRQQDEVSLANTVGSGANKVHYERAGATDSCAAGIGMNDRSGDEGASSGTRCEIMRDQALLGLGLPTDRMPQTEVALRLAEFILSLPTSGAMASVAIDGASIKVGDGVIFDIGRLMAATGWQTVKDPQIGRNAWTGAYQRGDKTIRVHSRPGEGDVVAMIDGRRIVAQCSKGSLTGRPGRAEQSLLRGALAEALLFDIADDDIVVTAVPDTPVFRKLAETWRRRPLVRRTGIRIALVGRDGAVSGLAL